ncbi:MAG TPA: helix-turn-helix domain-containing protein [Holophagaceae bacterium]|nr:helix-turn-helix domain-containing protein [Holophagaceae bacterium]
MKTLIRPDQNMIHALAERLKKAEGKSEFQRIQCILLRATLGASAEDIAQVVGWTTGTVRVMHSQYAKEGDSFFDVSRRGGRHRETMTEAQEAAFLSPFVERALAGERLDVLEIKGACERLLGHAVAVSTIYRMLARHGLRRPLQRAKRAQRLAEPRGQPAPC